VVEKDMNLSFVFCDHSDAGKSHDGASLTSEALAPIVASVLKQLNGEFAAEWGGTYVGRIGKSDGSDVVSDEIEVAIFQNEDVSGAAGYHDRDPEGRPYIHVALDDAATLTLGPSALSVIISHECCETAGDPGANRWADRAGSAEEALETCDRVEDTSYEVDSVSVSNFLLQSAFDPGSAAPWDHLNVLASEDGATPGGYVIERQQGTETTASADGALNIKVTRHVHVSRPNHESGNIGMTTEAAARYKKRKNHPASRTSRRGAKMG
jgi:hypothetical protein